MKLVKIIPAAALLGATLAGCGGGNSAYCGDLKEAKKSFSGVESGDASAIEEAFKTFHELADEAPDDIKADWKKLDGAITTVEDGLEKAGLKLSDLDDLQSGKLPEGVDAAKLQEVASSFTKLSDESFTKASENIEKHAKDECDVDLSSNS